MVGAAPAPAGSLVQLLGKGSSPFPTAGWTLLAPVTFSPRRFATKQPCTELVRGERSPKLPQWMLPGVGVGSEARGHGGPQCPYPECPRLSWA